MTSLTTIAAISSFGRAHAQPDHPGLQADLQRAAAEASQRPRRIGPVAAVLALLAAAVLPAHTASAAQGTGHAAQASVKDTATTHRVPGTCTPLRCR